MHIEPLSKDHDRESFDCGNEALNQFLKNSARQQAERNLSRTFVLTESAKTIIAYATLAPCEVNSTTIPASWARKYPHPVPATKLARLAVDKRFAKNGYGTHLLVDMMKKVGDAAATLAFVGLFVDAKTPELASWYEKFGFVKLADNPLSLFMPMATILRAFQESEV